MTQARRVVVLVGVLIAVALALLPVSHPGSAGPTGGGWKGGYAGGDPLHCGSAIVAFFRYDDECHDVARDRLTIAGVIAGVAVAGTAASVWVLRPARE